MTDSSSDEEDYSKLLQAADYQFISDDLFKVKPEKDVNDLQNKTLPPSLRNKNLEEWDQRNTTGLYVTPEFQKHVAKHLSNFLDRALKEEEPMKMKNPNKQKKRKEKGVKLLLSSSSYLDCKDAEDTSAAHNAKRKLRVADVDSEEENKKVKEVAVTSEWVLTGEAIKGWVKSTKGEVIEGKHKKKVKKKNKKKKLSLNNKSSLFYILSNLCS